MALSLRKAVSIDFPPLFVLVSEQAPKFQNDYDEPITHDWVKNLIESGELLVIDDNGYACGAFWFWDTLDDLHTTIHFLARPEYLRRIFKERILSQGLDYAFKVLGVGKVKAECMSTQKSAIKLLRKHKFYEYKPFYKDTKQNGKKVDVIHFELRRNYWEKT